jgi:hypothetical protein
MRQFLDNKYSVDNGDNLVSFANFLFCTCSIMAEQQPPPAAAQRMAGGITVVRLNPFWTNSPAAWFRAAKAQFMIRRVTCPLEKYYACGELVTTL